jgi:beta-galactosidase
MHQLRFTLSRVVKVLLLSATAWLPHYAFAADVTIPNGGFETAGKPVPDWNISDAGGSKSTFGIEKEAAHDGQSSLHLTKTNRDGYVVLQSAKIPVTEKSTFEVSAWLNSKTFSEANVYFMISQFKPGSDTMDLPNIFGPTRPLYSTGGQWEELKQLCTVRAGIDRVQISLIFSAAPIDVSVDDIQMTDLANYKPRYEPPTPETLMPQADAEKVLLARPRATAEVKEIGQRPRLFIDGKESFPGFYLGAAWKGTNSQIKDFDKAGVHVYLIPYVLGRGLYGDFGVWSGKDKTDFSELDDMMWRVLRADPHGYIMFYLCTDPYPQWGAEHPNDVVTDQDGNKVIVDMHFLRWGGEPKVVPGKAYVERYGYSYVSSDLRTDTEKVLSEFDQHIKNSLPGKAVIGYHVIGGNDGQMFAWGDFGSDHLSDYSQASLFAFRNWLKVKYTTNSNLQNAWHQPDVTFETAQVPSAKRRLGTAFFLNPDTDQDIADYNRFHSEGIVDTLDDYAKTLRQSHGSPIILGTYYSGPNSAVASHMATGYLLKNGMYNYVTSVLTYGAIRWPGGAGEAFQAWESLLLHSTFGLSEEDFRSWKTRPGTPESNYSVARVETAAESNAMIRRDNGRMLAYGQGNWWYDMSGGWFNDPSIMKAVKESADAYKLDLNANDFPRADVAVFSDERSIDYINPKNAPNTRYQNLRAQILQFNSSGVPFHNYLQSDVADPKLPDYKLYIFLDAYHLNQAEWDAIQKLRSDGKTICFVNAPGVVSQDLLNVKSAAAAIEKITGIHVTDNGEQNVALEPAPKSTFEGGDLISYGNITAPTFAVDDANAQILADYSTGHKPAVAMRDFGSWKSVFFGGIGMDAFFFNALAHQAGAWVAAPAGNAVYTNQHFPTIHAMYPGEKTVQLLQPSKVTDLADGKVLSSKTSTLHLNMQRGETRWFYLQQP